MAKTILIVEDDELVMKSFSDLLKSQNFNILQSFDGKDVMLLAREHRPDLILMDIRLPGITGFELTKMLKADDDLKDIPVIAVSGFVSQRDIEESYKNGFNGFIPKPVDISTFLTMVKYYIK